MTHKKLTKDEIKIALKHCANIHCICSDCILFEPEDDECQCSKDLKLNALDLINQYEAEIERLKDFATSKCEDCAGCTSWKCDCANIEAYAKAEAIKEFAERLKSIAGIYQKDTYVIGVDEFDNLLKEMGVE